MRVIARLQADGSRVWYVQASVDVPSGFKNASGVDEPSVAMYVEWGIKKRFSSKYPEQIS